MKTIAKNLILMIMAVSMLSKSTHAQCETNPIAFQKYFGGDLNDYLNSISSMGDGRFLVGGRINQSTANTDDMFVGVIDLNLEIMDAWKISTPSRDLINAVLAMEDGSYALAGSTAMNNTSATTDDWAYLNLNADGSVQHQKVFGSTTTNEELYALCKDSDGKIILAGLSTPGSGENRAVLKKVNSNGSVIWDFATGTENSKRFEDVVTTSNGDGFIAVGREDGVDGESLPIAFKVGNNGELIWSRIYDDDMVLFAENGTGYSRVMATPDNGALMICRYKKSDTDSDVLVVKLDEDGSVEWEKSFGGDAADTPRGCLLSLHGKYLIWGSTNSFGLGTDGFMLEMNLDGSIAWARRYGVSQTDAIYDVESFLCDSDNDGINDKWGYVAVGTTGSYSIDDVLDAWLLKVDSNGEGFDDCYVAEVPFVVQNRNLLASTVTSNGSWNAETAQSFTVTDDPVVPITADCGGISFVESPEGWTEVEDSDLISSNLELIPNPASSNCLISCGSDIERVNLYNSLGQFIHAIALPNGVSTIELSLDGYPKGLLFIQVVSANGQHFQQQLIHQ